MRFLMLLLLFFSGSLLAVECNLSGTQIEMNQCAFDDFKQADKKLNQVWKQLLAQSQDAPLYVKKLRAAQRAWIKFRDAEVAAMFACSDSEDMRLCWGSMYPLLYHIEMQELTEQRTQRLQQYLDEGQNPAVSAN